MTSFCAVTYAKYFLVGFMIIVNMTIVNMKLEKPSIYSLNPNDFISFIVGTYSGSWKISNIIEYRPM